MLQKVIAYCWSYTVSVIYPDCGTNNGWHASKVVISISQKKRSGARNILMRKKCRLYSIQSCRKHKYSSRYHCAYLSKLIFFNEIVEINKRSGKLGSIWIEAERSRSAILRVRNSAWASRRSRSRTRSIISFEKWIQSNIERGVIFVCSTQPAVSFNHNGKISLSEVDALYLVVIRECHELWAAESGRKHHRRILLTATALFESGNKEKRSINATTHKSVFSMMMMLSHIAMWRSDRT